MYCGQRAHRLKSIYWDCSERVMAYKCMLQGETEQNLALVWRIDVQFLDTPFFGVREMTRHLRNEDPCGERKAYRRPIRLKGLMPISKKPDTSKPAKGFKTYPHLMRGLRVGGPNQVRGVAITPPMHRGYFHLVASIDWNPRMVLS